MWSTPLHLHLYLHVFGGRDSKRGFGALSLRMGDVEGSFLSTSFEGKILSSLKA